MPNTISPAVLRIRYAEKYGKVCTLSNRTIIARWSTTRQHPTAKGKNVSRETLEYRASLVLLLMAQTQEQRR